jgi:hypothetical protein
MSAELTMQIHLWQLIRWRQALWNIVGQSETADQVCRDVEFQILHNFDHEQILHAFRGAATKEEKRKWVKDGMDLINQHLESLIRDMDLDGDF